MSTSNTSLSCRAYGLLAMLAALIGLASSAVTARFLVLGLERMEPDSLARQALVAAGVLMIVTELAAFGLAALLPKEQLQALRWRLMACGMLLLAFEAATIYVTQVTLVKAGESTAGSVATRMADLRVSIDSRRAAAAGLLDNGVRQSASIHGINRAAGADALGHALDAERQIEVMTVELAQLESTKTPTLTDVLGETGMLAYSVARALLISIMGLAMFSAAGSLLRSARGVAAGAAVADASVATVTTAVPAVATTVATTIGYRLAGVAPRSTPYSFSAFAKAVPLAAIGVAPMACAVPVPVAAGVAVPVAVGVAPAIPVAQFATTPTQLRAGTSAATVDARYERVKAAVLEGSLKPSVRSVQSAFGGSTLSARRYLHQLAVEKVLEPSGRGWARAAALAQGTVG